MSLSSDEVNLLVYRYLQESGFRHSAFTFGHESLLARTPAVESDVPYGSLSFEDAKARVTANETDKVTLVSAETAVMLAGPQGRGALLRLQPLGKTLASGGTDGTMRLGSFPAPSDAARWLNGSARAELSEHSGTVLGLAFSPSDSYLASCGLDGRVSVTECEAFTSMPPISTHRAPVLDLAWQSDSVLATASADRTVQIHKVGTERAPRVFAGHSADVNCVEWDPTRTLLASCSDDASPCWASARVRDATVRLWDVNAAVLQSTLRGPQRARGHPRDSALTAC
ncbi:hypothetical protein FNF29_08288 [Cafeteria roenbergensis]|uniref:LisH domain-containing protein n=1 Tax=Cafeteria roenbergensis TaxID=33653 RepID=A0A5A8C1P6_CAFRO|nr:hypothetical protein FNF29_08288 [Cafeteria roenbergensis]|eukprot:KAA0146020.1 hypothetical protein FNF29_08288 [Cafeteria roenbergensis]